jgi:hypothetical protein
MMKQLSPRLGSMLSPENTQELRDPITTKRGRPRHEKDNSNHHYKRTAPQTKPYS